MYQIELSPRKATPTQAKKQIAQLIYYLSLCLYLPPSTSTSPSPNRVFNFGVPSPNFTATWYLSTLSSLLLSIIIITCVVWCFSYHIVFFIFYLKCGKWKHGYWLVSVVIVLGLFYWELCYADFVCGIQTH